MIKRGVNTIGILGSGQLGRMLALAARRFGYAVYVFSPERASPAGQVADVEVAAPYEDLAAVAAFARRVDVVTYEFENVPAATAAAAAAFAPLRPGVEALAVAQNRLREKQFFVDNGLPVAPFLPIDSADALPAALAQIGCPAVLKTADSGYDGKGQYLIPTVEAAEELARSLRFEGGGAPVPFLLEEWVEFECEVSVIAARGLDGCFAHYGVIANEHRNHILDVSVAPAGVPKRVAARAVEMARSVLEALDVVGVLGVEFFLASGGRLLLNEIAPRPHNSGHLTIDACITSQFEQQLRAVCGLPLGSTAYHSPAAMANLLGELWQKGEPDWKALLALPGLNLHLYGKRQPRQGRKMGHLTALAADPAAAEQQVRQARRLLET